jgi:serine/threonine-protein kinase
MAPEQLAGEPVTGAADQFGLGVMLVELVTGTRPFIGETPWALCEAIRGGAQLSSGPTALPSDLTAIAERTLAFDARDRYASVDELRFAIADVLRYRAAVTALDLGTWVRARIAART